MENNPPQSVRIGSIDYHVIQPINIKDDQGNEVIGAHIYDASELQVWDSLSPPAKRATLWHEIIHAILTHAGHTDEHDERTVSAISNGVVQVLRDNPELVKYTTCKAK